MPDFKLVAPFEPTGDQPVAIERLADGLARGLRHQVLLGATGTGKTFTLARVIEQANRPTLVLAHNKTLAAQLYAEFRDFFPENAVEYFVSYFDYYQPEAYLPRSDTYIEKDSSRNEEIDKLRHAATKALFERRDVIIVASVSCIYGLGAPVDYGATVLRLKRGGAYRRDTVLRHLVDLQYQRNDQALQRSRFRVRGDTLELVPSAEDRLVRVEFFGDEVERITELDPLTGELLAERSEVNVFPASHFVTPADKLRAAIETIGAEADERVAQLEEEGRALEAARLRQRTTFDLEMIRELGFCSGIENYSRHLSGREPGSRPWTLLDYFPPDWLLVVDESHMTIPQVVGMYKNDRTRKEILVDFGFRLPSALDNRPLTFEEFEATVNQVVYMSATPGPYELERSERMAEQLIRPTGIVDPQVTVRPTEGQIDDLLERIRERVERGERVLVTTLTKRMAEDLTDYLRELGVKVQYLHSEVDTLERVQILRDLRLGIFDVLVGINLLREGIDLPEVTLVAILDADKEGFLRSAWSLIQMTGRAARNIGGEVVMYADVVTESMRVAIDETNRRRGIQQQYNAENGITPLTIVKEIRDINDRLRVVAESAAPYGPGGGSRDLDGATKAQVEKLVARLETEMRAAARELDFERAAALRDEVQQIRLRVLEEDASLVVGRAAEAAGRGAAPSRRGRRPGAPEAPPAPVLEVTEVTVVAAGGGAGGRGGDGSGLAARPPRRARRRGRRRLAGPLARPPDMGPNGHSERAPPHGEARHAALSGKPATGRSVGRPLGRADGQRRRCSARDRLPGGGGSAGRRTRCRPRSPRPRTMPSQPRSRLERESCGRPLSVGAMSHRASKAWRPSIRGPTRGPSRDRTHVRFVPGALDSPRALRPVDRARRARAQPQERDRRDPARPARRDHRPVRLREEQPRLRHDLRRGPAPLRREPLGVCPPVPGPDGEAGRRPDRRPQPRHLHRPEGRRPQPAVHGRDRHRDLRPPAAALRPHRPSRTARPAAARSSARPSSRSWTRSSGCPTGTRLLVLGPLVKDRKTEGDRVFEAARKQGFVRVRVDGEQMDLSETTSLDKYKRHTIEVVVDRFVVRAPERAGEAPPDAARLADSIETALRLGEGVVVVAPAPAPGRRPTSRSAATASATAAPTTGRRSTSWSRGASPSTRRTAPARPAPASDRSWSSTRISSSRTARRASPTARSSPGRACRPRRRGG